MQDRLHDQMQTEMQTTRGLLDDVTVSAVSLKAAVDSTATIIGRLASLTEVTRWIAAVVVGLMVLFVFHLISPKFAAYLSLTSSQYCPCIRLLQILTTCLSILIMRLLLGFCSQTRHHHIQHSVSRV